MFRKLIKNKKAQNTAEYAILIALVVAGIIAMQTYAQRALQARVRDAAQHLADLTNDLGNTVQYEPYYLTSNYQVDRVQEETQRLGQNLVRDEVETDTIRRAGGFQKSDYDEFGLINGL